MSDIIDQNEILNNIKKDFNAGNTHNLTTKDYDCFKKLLKSAKSNDNEHQTKFPDFSSEEGFIEHFHVTSGKSNKKGHAVTIQQSEMKKTHDNFEETITLNNNNNIAVGGCETSFLRNKDSIENFHKSFKKNWEKHIEHLNKYEGVKHLSCFLISSDDVLIVDENSKDENSICFGDLVNSKKEYCLSYDKELLNYIYEFRNDIDFVIYYNVGNKKVEVIKTKNIPALQNYFSNRKFKIHSRIVWEDSITYSVSVRNKKDEGAVQKPK